MEVEMNGIEDAREYDASKLLELLSDQSPALRRGFVVDPLLREGSTSAVVGDSYFRPQFFYP